jgi:hypothetical protein
MIDFIVSNANYISFIFCAALGGVTHYLKKYIKKETDVSIVEWFSSSNLNASIYTGIVFTFIIIGTISSGVITADMNFWAVMYSGFMTGFAIDSGVNSDDKSITRGIIDVQRDISELKSLGEDQPQEHPEQIFATTKKGK